MSLLQRNDIRTLKEREKRTNIINFEKQYLTIFIKVNGKKVNLYVGLFFTGL